MEPTVRSAEPRPAPVRAPLTLSVGVGLGLIALAALLRVVAYPPFSQGWCIWVSLVPLLLLVRWGGWWSRHPFLAGWLAGFAWQTGLLWWVGHVTVQGTLLLTAYLALYPAVWLWVVAAWARRLEERFGPFGETDDWRRSRVNLAWAGLAAGWWVVLEFLRGWLLTGFGWNGPGGALWENIPLLQLASLGGVLLLSALVVFVNAATAAYVTNLAADLRAGIAHSSRLELYALLLLVAVVFAWGFWHAAPEGFKTHHRLRYVLVQPNIPQTRHGEPMPTHEKIRRHLDSTRAGIAMVQARDWALPGTDVVIWPEATTFFDPRVHEGFRLLVQNLANEAGAPLLFGAQYSEPLDQFTAVYDVAPEGDPRLLYLKNHLVLFGEYIPLLDVFPFLSMVAPVPVPLSPGTKVSAVEVTGPDGPTWLVPLICFEDSVPRLVRAAVRNAPRPAVLVNMTNDSWFKDSPGAWVHLANAVPRTVETGLPMLRATNTGVTAVISPTGVVQEVLRGPDGRAVGAFGALEGRLAWTPRPPTFYQRWGDWPAPLAALVCFLGGLSLSRKRSHG
ncbi:MAG: apolipoprotein N-acyltransferase [Verrucomicrobiota bacterium]